MIGESTIAVVVTDDGPGVPAEELPKVVDRFWRSDASSGKGSSITTSSWSSANSSTRNMTLTGCSGKAESKPR